MKLLIIGHGGHGKDEVSKIISKNYGLEFESSSSYLNRKFIFDKLKDKYGYKSLEECHKDRRNHRTEWYELIRDYNKDDLARLGREIFSEKDIYCGLRDKNEFLSIREEKLYDYCIWVDRTKHNPPEASMYIKPEMSDFIIDNNGSLIELEDRVNTLMKTITQ